jgi:type IV pilus assembly protein PilW
LIDTGRNLARSQAMEKASQKRMSRGYTLVEIMVAMVITLIVMGGVYQAMVDENVNQERKENILEMQNNARVSMTSLVKDIRRAGFLGCGGTLAANTLTNSGTDATFIGKLTIAQAPPAGTGLARDMANYNTILKQLIDFPDFASPQTFDYLGVPLGFSDDAPAGHDFYAEGTDALTLVFLSGETMVDPAIPMGSGTANIQLKTGAFDQDDILVVSDCENYSIFQKTNGNGLNPVAHAANTGLNGASDDLQKNYGQGAPARVYKLNTATYFITKGDFNFCYNNINQPVANNIEDLQFQFLFDEDDDDDLAEEVWQDDLGAHDPQDVRAIRIWLLAMSEPDYGYTDKNNYNYPNSPYCDAAWAADPDSSCSGVGTPASFAPMASPSAGEHRHRYLASAVVLLRNSGN